MDGERSRVQKREYFQAGVRNLDSIKCLWEDPKRGAFQKVNKTV